MAQESALLAWATSLTSSSSACCQRVVSGSCFGVGPWRAIRNTVLWSHTVLLWALWCGVLSVAGSRHVFRRDLLLFPGISPIHTTPTDWRTVLWFFIFMDISSNTCHFYKAGIRQKSPINTAVLSHPFIGYVPLCPLGRLNSSKPKSVQYLGNNFNHKKDPEITWFGQKKPDTSDRAILCHLTPAEANWLWGTSQIMSVWPQQGLEN